MRRRAFLALLGGMTTAIQPFVASAQNKASPRHIGILLVGLSPDSKAAQAFRQGLRDAGYDEARDLVIEWRSAEGDYDRVPGLVAELVRNRVDVIVMDSTVGTEVAKRATSTIPIVMALVLDPVGSGLVNSLARPGGNVTGLSMMTTPELNAKRLQLLKELMPQLARAAVMWNPDHPLHARAIEELKARAPQVAVDLSFLAVTTREQLDQAFLEIGPLRAQALYVVEDPFFFAHRLTVLNRASAIGLPTMHDLRRWPDAGALMSYGPDLDDLFRRSASYVDRILKGAKPADLPIEQPTKFELVINLKTASALGLTVPQSLLQRAHEAIE